MEKKMINESANNIKITTISLSLFLILSLYVYHCINPGVKTIKMANFVDSLSYIEKEIIKNYKIREIKSPEFMKWKITNRGLKKKNDNS